MLFPYKKSKNKESNRSKLHEGRSRLYEQLRRRPKKHFAQNYKPPINRTPNPPCARKKRNEKRIAKIQHTGRVKNAE